MSNFKVNPPAGEEWYPEFSDAIQVITSGGTADLIDWENIKNKPDTVDGYGITDACTAEDLKAALVQKADAATTLLGYGITDAKIDGNVITLGENSIAIAEESGELNSHIADETKHATSEVKNSPECEDSFVIVDSADGNKLKRFPVANVNALFACVLRITFDNDFCGQEYTVTDENGESYSGTVPDNLMIDVNVNKKNTTYKISSAVAGGNKHSVSVATGDFFGLYEVSLIIPRAMLNVTTCVGASVKCSNGANQLSGVGSTAFTLPNTGSWTVEAELNGLAVSQTIEISEIKQYNIDMMITSSLLIVTPPHKIVYDIGDTFDSSGIAVHAIYADETSENVTNACSYSPAVMKDSTVEVTVSYTRVGITVSTAQAVTIKLLSKISIATPPFKTTYYVGESFDSTGTVIQATMTDGSTKSVIGWTYSPSGAMSSDAHTITFSYSENGVTKTCDYQVVLRCLERISVTSDPANLTYHYGDTFNSSGMEITAEYNDGSSRKVDGWTFTPTEPLTAQSNEIIISYTEGNITKTCVQPITVLKLESLVVTAPPKKTSYIFGEVFDSNGMLISAVYEDGSIRVVSGWSYSPVEPLALDDESVTISYTEGDIIKHIIQSITVSNRLEKITITTPPSKTDYTFDEQFDKTGMVVMATYIDGTTKEVLDYSWEPNIISKDTKNVTISFTDLGDIKSATVELTVYSLYDLNSCTWAQIREISDSGTAADYWSVGDTKSIVLNGVIGDTPFNNYSVDAFILGFDHNAELEGKNRIHFSIGKADGRDIALKDKQYYNNSAYGMFSHNQSCISTGGWEACRLRKTVLGNDGTPEHPIANSFMAACPSELVSVLKPVIKYTNNVGDGLPEKPEYITATTDYFFLLSIYEVFKIAQSPYEGEKQCQYSYYIAGNSAQRYFHHQITTSYPPTTWSLRTPYNKEGLFSTTTNDGRSYSGVRADYHYALSPAFCV